MTSRKSKTKKESILLLEKEKEIESLHKEFDNYKKYVDRKIKDAERNLTKKLLVVVDSLDRAIEYQPPKNPQDAHRIVNNMASSIAQIQRQLLDKLNLTVINPQKGEDFKEEMHTVDNAVESSENIVIKEVIQKGYLLQNEVIRPAKVMVKRGDEDE